MNRPPWVERMGEPPPFSRWWLDQRRVQIRTTHTVALRSLERYADLPLPPYRSGPLGSATVAAPIPLPPAHVRRSSPPGWWFAVFMADAAVGAAAVTVLAAHPGAATGSTVRGIAACVAVLAVGALLVLLARARRPRRARPDGNVGGGTPRWVGSSHTVVHDVQSARRHEVHREETRRELQRHTYVWTVTVQHCRLLVGLLGESTAVDALAAELRRLEDPTVPCPGVDARWSVVADGGRTRYGLAASLLVLADDYHPWPLWRRFRQVEQDLAMDRGLDPG
ncbi:hypothetical protein ACIBFB_25920 [Nocardiopsis sp. NPDC050513]|uniref:hypothetical protein n=1 Tax=Nocardiopsis sp. NPDC050513 TaxID=3364338 RepID=UPI0037AF37F8